MYARLPHGLRVQLAFLGALSSPTRTGLAGSLDLGRIRIGPEIAVRRARPSPAGRPRVAEGADSAWRTEGAPSVCGAGPGAGPVRAAAAAGRLRVAGAGGRAGPPALRTVRGQTAGPRPNSSGGGCGLGLLEVAVSAVLR
ncbi:hypothetical protein NDU88_006802 [Pleurodeles waltl]|uniref:Uncharacterized protein n=1 Tax=Pleurodeles waltl TaxID=8319 RepID=A0AAV7NU73_PLEWA|nr:hypothetical protein NDU88_006802 [Pleurodeles waltl]